MIVAPSAELDRARCVALGASLWEPQPLFAYRERQRAKGRPWYRRALSLELLQDLERELKCPPDRSPRMLRAADVLADQWMATGVGFYAMTPQRLIQSRTCQLSFRCDRLATQAQLLANLNPAPNLVIRGNLTQRVSVRVEIDALNLGTLGSTTLKIWFNGGVGAPSITGYVTTATLTQLVDNGHDTGLWLSCAAGPYFAGNAWVSRLVALGDESGQSGDRDLINAADNISTMFDYTANDAAIRGHAWMASDATRATFFSSAWVPPDPGVTPSMVLWVSKVITFVTTGRLWGTGTVNQFCVRQANPSPNCAQAGAVAVNSNALMTVGTWAAHEALFFDSALDAFKVAGNARLVSGVAGGCASGVPNSGVTLGARANTGALPSTMGFAMFNHFTGGDGTGDEMKQYRAWNTVNFGVAA